MNDDNIAYFNRFAVKYIPEEIKKFIANKNITANIFRTQTYDSIISGYFLIKFTDFPLKGKGLLEYTNLFSSNEYEMN